MPEKIVSISVMTRTYYDFSTTCKVECEATNDELQELADKFYRITDGALYAADEATWELVEARARQSDDSAEQPSYRAKLVNGCWKIKEC